MQWLNVHGSRTFISDSDDGYAWLGANTIIRKRDSIMFESTVPGTYARYRGTCRKRIVDVLFASDSLVSPRRFSSANGFIGRVLDDGCGVSR